jgi:hypothetical protein
MSEPTALGLVRAMLVDPKGKMVKNGAAVGQLYLHDGTLLVVRPSPMQDLFHRAMLACLFGSVALVLANIALWKSYTALWVAIGLQGIYWAALPARRRLMLPATIDATTLDAARKAGRAAIAIPAASVTGVSEPEAPRPGFRRPARLELPEGALEMYGLSPEQYQAVRAALGR